MHWGEVSAFVLCDSDSCVYSKKNGPPIYKRLIEEEEDSTFKRQTNPILDDGRLYLCPFPSFSSIHLKKEKIHIWSKVFEFLKGFGYQKFFDPNEKGPQQHHTACLLSLLEPDPTPLPNWLSLWTTTYPFFS